MARNPEALASPGEDLFDHLRGLGIDRQAGQLNALTGLFRVGMGDPGANQLIAVGRSPSEVAPLGSHGSHGGSHPHPQPVAFGPAESAEEGQDDVVDLRVGIDRSLQFGYPESDAVVVELGQHGLDLAGVAEGPLGFADDDARPAPAGVGQLKEEG